MVHMNIADANKIEVDFREEYLPISIKLFKPVLFHEGEIYYCLLGPDPEDGIFGYGNTTNEALINWDNHLRERIKSKDPTDEVAQYVINLLDDSVEFS